MALVAGDKVGPYEILSLLGEGGMGQVWKARDTRLNRFVAIKTMRERFSERFEREARAIAALNHPHICSLYDVGPDYLVMEYIEGVPLKGPMHVDQALQYAVQICEALDAAHRKGITHRDLKPANILVTKNGVKLLDFGLAKLGTPGQAAAPQSDATATMTITAKDQIVGTLYYMSPEQLEAQATGQEIDSRSDIFSFGIVLYEMITGKRPFEGSSPASVVGAIMERSAPSIAAVAPAALDHLIAACLAKDREKRWQTAHDAGLELRWIAQGDSAGGARAPQSHPGKGRERVAWPIAAVLSLLCLALAYGFFARSPRPVHLVRSSVLPPPGSSFLPYNFAIAPDGSRLAFVALGPDGKTALWVRALSSSSAQQLAGTEDASQPFWSPDSLHIGFFAEGRLKSVDLVNSAVQMICDSAGGFGGTWNQDSVIVFAPAVAGPIYRVAAKGGTPEAVTRIPPGSGESQHWPFFLPDGRHFLYVVNWSGPANERRNGLYVGSLDLNEAPKFISPENDANVLFASAHLLYVRDRTIVAQPFDTAGLRATGAAIPLTQPEVDKFFDFWQSGFSVSQDGKLIFQSAADSPQRLVWYDPAGKELGQFPEVGYEGPQFSPDGQSIAVFADDQHNGKHFIRLYDLKRGISTRLTEGGHESNAIWSPDGKALAFRDAHLNIDELPADASAPPTQLVRGTNVIPCDWSRDGHLIYMSIGTGNSLPSLEVYFDHKSTEFATAGAEAQFSPDGKWVAYVTLPIRQVVVQRFPGLGTRVPISSLSPSTQPRWSRDGRNIYFVQPDRKIMVVAFDAAKGTAGPPQVFAQTRIAVTVFGWFQYAVSPDNRLLVDSLPANNSAPLTLLSGWDTDLDHH
jgi:serine/threonine protein kinase